jgi:3-methyladenine DNA glycosylase AlkD
MTSSEIVKLLKTWRDPKNIAGMARFGISAKGTLGVPVPKLRGLAKKIGTDHALALKLWKTGIHETRLLATMVADASALAPEQADAWTADFDSWDTCDQACMNLYRWTPFAWKKIGRWAKDEREFVRRAGFALIAALASGDRETKDEKFIALFPLIKKYSTDERNFVRKAVNWALRGIGKRNMRLNAAALKAAKEISKLDSKSARWVAANAIWELSDPKIIALTKRREIVT